MIIDILTIFPEMFAGPFGDSIIKRAIEKQAVTIDIHNLRDWTTDVHRSVDDRPYGGGAGMVMRVDVIDRAVNDCKLQIANHKLKPPGSGSQSAIGNQQSENCHTVLLDTKGPFYTQAKAQELATYDHLIFIAGHYEGIDHRVHDHVVDEVISIGPYVLTGGELPTMVVVDSIVRLLPGVINEESLKEESYQGPHPNPLLKGERILTPNPYPLSPSIEYPQYTRPAEYKGWKVPEILLNGNHKEIEKWRKSTQSDLK